MKFSADLDAESILNLFIANEFFAWQQYFLARVVAKGKSLKYAEGVFADNGNEELDDHFKELVEYAQSMGFDPEVNPKQMEKNTSSPYRELDLSQPTKELVIMLIDEEKQAIDEYEAAAKGKATKEHPSLCFMFSEFAKDERVHLKELEDLLGDIESESGVDKPVAKIAKDEKDSEDKDEKSDNDEDDEKSEDDKKESDEDDDDEDNAKDKKERKIGKDFDFAKDFKNAGKKKDEDKENEDDKDDEKGGSINESVIGTYAICEHLLSEAIR